jgi:hypothetical protein
MLGPASDPRALLRLQRQRLLTYAAPGPGDAVPPADLPQAVADLVRSYERADHGTRVDVYWFVHLNGSTATAQGDVGGVPNEDEGCRPEPHRDHAQQR